MGSGLYAPLPRDYLHALCQMVRLLAALGSLFLFQGGIAQLAAPVDAVLRFHPMLLLAALYVTPLRIPKPGLAAICLLSAVGALELAGLILAALGRL